MKTRTTNILVILQVIAYIAMVGYAIETCGRLVTLVADLINPVYASRTYMADQELLSLQQKHPDLVLGMMGLTVLVSSLKLYVWILVIQLLTKLNMKAPFSMEVSRKIEKIALWLLWIGMISLVGGIYTGVFSRETGVKITERFGEGEFLFIAAITYVISQVFKRGIEIQEENQLTV